METDCNSYLTYGIKKFETVANASKMVFRYRKVHVFGLVEDIESIEGPVEFGQPPNRAALLMTNNRLKYEGDYWNGATG